MKYSPDQIRGWIAGAKERIRGLKLERKQDLRDYRDSIRSEKREIRGYKKMLRGVT